MNKKFLMLWLWLQLQSLWSFGDSSHCSCDTVAENPKNLDSRNCSCCAVGVNPKSLMAAIAVVVNPKTSMAEIAAETTAGSVF